MFKVADWKDASTGLSAASIIVSGVGASLPDPYAKIALAAGVALANAAVFCAKHNENGEKANP